MGLCAILCARFQSIGTQFLSYLYPLTLFFSYSRYVLLFMAIESIYYCYFNSYFLFIFAHCMNYYCFIIWFPSFTIYSPHLLYRSFQISVCIYTFHFYVNNSCCVSFCFSLISLPVFHCVHIYHSALCALCAKLSECPYKISTSY